MMGSRQPIVVPGPAAELFFQGDIPLGRIEKKAGGIQIGFLIAGFCQVDAGQDHRVGRRQRAAAART